MRRDQHLKHVGTAEVAVELAADIFPVVLRIELGFRLRQERRDDKIEPGAKVRPQIDADKIARVERPSLQGLRDRRLARKRDRDGRPRSELSGG